MNFSKSKYCCLWQCPKMCWLKKYKPEAEIIDATLQSRFETGKQVGNLAKELFGNYVEATVLKSDGSLDIPAMLERTRRLIESGEGVICEAAFSFKGLYCAVDILRKTESGYMIYEVKSSTHNEYIYSVDVAFQKYVLQKCGINIVGTFLVNIDNAYIRRGELDIHKLFKFTDVSEWVSEEEKIVESNLEYAEKLLANDTEPEIDIDLHCSLPYDCGFWEYCTKDIPKPSVFDLYRLSFNNKIASYKKKIITYQDVLDYGLKISDIQRRQIEYALKELPDHIDKDGIKSFLSNLSYPLYFLDFETMQPAVPQFDNSKPYAQIPFQYSLHYIECEGGELKHKEFLAVSGEDPRRAIAESLCDDIPDNVCVLAYNKAFECTRLEELAALFSDLAEHLLKIRFNIKDLLTPFQGGHYYNREMGGSFSIKSVLPALFPDEPSLNYHNLEGVHNGSEAMSIFPEIKNMPKAEAEAARQNLLRYCELDTYAMVKVWEKLKSLIVED